jgi:hypothetical protein
MNFNLNAREEVSLEIRGRLAPSDKLSGLLPAGMELCVEEGRAQVLLRQSRVEKLNWHAFPYYRVHCDVAVWSVETVFEGRRGWYVLQTDMNHTILRSAAGMVFGVPVKDAEFTFLEKRKSLITSHQHTSGGELRLHVELGQEARILPQVTPIFLRGKGRTAVINVVANDVDFCRISQADIVKDELSRRVFGETVDWQKECHVLRGRELEWFEEVEEE